MSVLKVSGAVRRQMGGNNADALAAGSGLPADAQCWHCGKAINLFAARPGSVTLSVVAVGLVSVSAFGHAEHTVSRVFTPEQFQQAASGEPSPVTGDSDLLVEGRLVEVVAGDPGPAAPGAGDLGDAGGPGARLILTLRCPGCAQLPDLVLSPSQVMCGNDDGCGVLQFDPSLEAAEQWANGKSVGPLVGEGGIPERVAAYHAALREVPVRGSAADDMREREIRAVFHRYGYRCADPGGVCEVCGHDGRIR